MSILCCVFIVDERQKTFSLTIDPVSENNYMKRKDKNILIIDPESEGDDIKTEDKNTLQ